MANRIVGRDSSRLRQEVVNLNSMRSKNVTTVLALFLGLFGVHRFYLGQYERGALYLLYPIMVLLAVFAFSGTMEIAKSELSLELSFSTIVPLLPFLIVPLFDTLWFARMSKDKFDERYNTKRANWLGESLTSLGYILLAVVVVWWLYDRYLVKKVADVAKTEAAFEVSAEEFAAAYDTDEDAAAEKYDEQVVRITGRVLRTDEFNAQHEQVLPLAGSGFVDISCNLQQSALAKAQGLEVGQEVIVKGRVLQKMNFEVVLNDCLIEQVGDVIAPETVTIDSLLMPVDTSAADTSFIYEGL